MKIDRFSTCSHSTLFQSETHYHLTVTLLSLPDHCMLKMKLLNCLTERM